jgi:lipoprotein-anchoring transpeptidase ErfK/SrfK
MSLVLLGGMVFGAGPPISKSFDITATVTGRLELKVSKVVEANIANWNTTTDMTGTSLTDASPVQLYLHILNNQKVDLTVKVSATAFSNTDTSAPTTYVIPYKIKDTDTTITVGSGGTTTETVLTTITHSNRGLRVDTVGFSVDPDDTEFTNAAVGSYSSTITFNVTTA